MNKISSILKKYCNLVPMPNQSNDKMNSSSSPCHKSLSYVPVVDITSDSENSDNELDIESIDDNAPQSSSLMKSIPYLKDLSIEQDQFNETNEKDVLQEFLSMIEEDSVVENYNKLLDDICLPKTLNNANYHGDMSTPNSDACQSTHQSHMENNNQTNNKEDTIKSNVQPAIIKMSNKRLPDQKEVLNIKSLHLNGNKLVKIYKVGSSANSKKKASEKLKPILFQNKPSPIETLKKKSVLSAEEEVKSISDHLGVNSKAFIPSKLVDIVYTDKIIDDLQSEIDFHFQEADASKYIYKPKINCCSEKNFGLKSMDSFDNEFRDKDPVVGSVLPCNSNPRDTNNIDLPVFGIDDDIIIPLLEKNISPKLQNDESFALNAVSHPTKNMTCSSSCSSKINSEPETVKKMEDKSKMPFSNDVIDINTNDNNLSDIADLNKLLNAFDSNKNSVNETFLDSLSYYFDKESSSNELSKVICNLSPISHNKAPKENRFTAINSIESECSSTSLQKGIANVEEVSFIDLTEDNDSKKVENSIKNSDKVNDTEMNDELACNNTFSNSVIFKKKKLNELHEDNTEAVATFNEYLNMINKVQPVSNSIVHKSKNDKPILIKLKTVRSKSSVTIEHPRNTISCSSPRIAKQPLQTRVANIVDKSVTTEASKRKLIELDDGITSSNNHESLINKRKKNPPKDISKLVSNDNSQSTIEISKENVNFVDITKSSSDGSLNDLPVSKILLSGAADVLCAICGNLFGPTIFAKHQTKCSYINGITCHNCKETFDNINLLGSHYLNCF